MYSEWQDITGYYHFGISAGMLIIAKMSNPIVCSIKRHIWHCLKSEIRTKLDISGLAIALVICRLQIWQNHYRCRAALLLNHQGPLHYTIAHDSCNGVKNYHYIAVSCKIDQCQITAQERRYWTNHDFQMVPKIINILRWVVHRTRSQYWCSVAHRRHTKIIAKLHPCPQCNPEEV